MSCEKAALRVAFFCFALLLQPGIALSHGEDKPKHGGVMGRGDEAASVEFVYEEGVVTVYVEEQGTATPIPSSMLKGAWLSVIGPGRPAQEAKLTPAGGNKLTAAGLAPRAGDRLRARLILPDGTQSGYTATFREAASRR